MEAITLVRANQILDDLLTHQICATKARGESRMAADLWKKDCCFLKQGRLREKQAGVEERGFGSERLCLIHVFHT